MTEQTAQDQQHEGINEYERTPVPPRARLGFKSFIGMYAGEHCAGTELMIGPLFVAAGVSAFDVVVGLLVGNFLAVLSWMFLTAPIATRARLTLYYQLEKICGRKLVTTYNLANGVMFCFLAGSMITVSATAFGVWFKFPMPALTDVYPNSVGWVLAVAAVGSLIAVVAAFGYNAVAKFANIASPWMVLVFLVFGIVGFRDIVAASGREIHSAGDLWNFAATELWRGGAAQPGQVKFTFLHVMFFSWFTNAAMHVGMSDLTVFRYARKSWYGVASGAGMYVGHFMAWLAASLLYAHQLRVTPDNTDVLPGPMAFKAAGLAGLICVIIAGWTTANPTIYRAGLAFQAIVPKWPRFTVTLITGLIATIAGMFPVIAMKLLGFVALYGLLLIPMGAVIFVDFWLMPRIGLKDRFAERSGTAFNWAAGAAWIATLAICLFLNFNKEALAGYVNPDMFQIYFLLLPAWFIAGLLYIASSILLQKAAGLAAGAAKVLAAVALMGTVAPAVFYFTGEMTDKSLHAWLMGATVLWFVTAAFAMGSKAPAEPEQEILP